jgi:hypothetical protein
MNLQLTSSSESLRKRTIDLKNLEAVVELEVISKLIRLNSMSSTSLGSRNLPKPNCLDKRKTKPRKKRKRPVLQEDLRS